MRRVLFVVMMAAFAAMCAFAVGSLSEHERHDSTRLGDDAALLGGGRRRRARVHGGAHVAGLPLSDRHAHARRWPCCRCACRCRSATTSSNLLRAALPAHAGHGAGRDRLPRPAGAAAGLQARPHARRPGGDDRRPRRLVALGRLHLRAAPRPRSRSRWSSCSPSSCRSRRSTTSSSATSRAACACGASSGRSLASGVALALLGIVQVATGWVIVNREGILRDGETQNAFRANSLFWDPNMFGRFCALMVLLGVACSWRRAPAATASWWRRGLPLAAAGPRRRRPRTDLLALGAHRPGRRRPRRRAGLAGPQEGTDRRARQPARAGRRPRRDHRRARHASGSARSCRRRSDSTSSPAGASTSSRPGGACTSDSRSAASVWRDSPRPTRSSAARTRRS